MNDFNSLLKAKPRSKLVKSTTRTFSRASANIIDDNKIIHNSAKFRSSLGPNDLKMYSASSFVREKPAVNEHIPVRNIQMVMPSLIPRKRLSRDTSKLTSKNRHSAGNVDPHFIEKMKNEIEELNEKPNKKKTFQRLSSSYTIDILKKEVKNTLPGDINITPIAEENI